MATAGKGCSSSSAMEKESANCLEATIQLSCENNPNLPRRWVEHLTICNLLNAKKCSFCKEIKKTSWYIESRFQETIKRL